MKPCPFCGGTARIRHTVGYWGFCLDDDCGAIGGDQPTEAEAIAAWNQRAGEAELAALRALREGVDLEIMPVQAIAAILCSLHPDAAKLAGWIDRLQLALAACDEAMKGDSDV